MPGAPAGAADARFVPGPGRPAASHAPAGAPVVRAIRAAPHPRAGAEAPPMASQADVRRIALSLPETEEAPDRFAFSVRNKGKRKGFVWVWMERVTPKKPRVPQPAVIAVRGASLVDKDLLLTHNPAKFFTEPHYDGFPAILVRSEEHTSELQSPYVISYAVF